MQKSLTGYKRRLALFSFLAIGTLLSGQETGEKRSEYIPDIDGILKTKV